MLPAAAFFSNRTWTKGMCFGSAYCAGTVLGAVQAIAFFWHLLFSSCDCHDLLDLAFDDGPTFRPKYILFCQRLGLDKID
jgi:hypothetical protein